MEALFAENATESSEKTVTLRIGDIEPNRDQPRKQFDDEALAELASSIAQHGVLQPLLVRPLPGGGYQLLAGLQEVPVVIRELNDREAAELAMIENLQREDLNPMEEALGYKTLMESYGMTQEEAAGVVNKSRSAVANALRLLHLPAPVSELVAGGRLSAGAARALLSFPEEEQTALAREAADGGLSVRELEKRAKLRARDTSPNVSRETSPSRDSFYDEVELALTEHMGRRIKVSRSKTGGTLQIEFYDKDDLQSLANRLAPEEPAQG